MTDSMPDIFYQDQQLTTSPHRSASPGEQSLWQRVMIQVVNDAIGKVPDVSDKGEKRSIQRYAIRWLLESGRDFHMVCDLAGLNPDWVKGNVMKLLRKGGAIGEE